MTSIKLTQAIQLTLIAVFASACTNLAASTPAKQTAKVLTSASASASNNSNHDDTLVTYQLDPHHSNVRFSIDHMHTSTVTGGFYELTGKVQYSDTAKTGHVNLTIPMNSLHSVSKQFTKHLKGKDFFDTAKYPTAQFTSSKWHFASNDDDSNLPHKVTAIDGNLTMHGKTHPVTLTATRFNCYFSPVVKKTMCGGDFTTTIDRTNWGINKYVMMGVARKLRIDIEIEGIRQ